MSSTDCIPFNPKSSSFKIIEKKSYQISAFQLSAPYPGKSSSGVMSLVMRGVGVGEGSGTLLQYSCLENPMDGGAWWAAVHGVAKSRTRLSDFTFTFHFHALEEEMATHSSVLVWRIPGGAWWAAVCGVAQSWTRLKRLSSSSSSKKYLVLTYFIGNKLS